MSSGSVLSRARVVSPEMMYHHPEYRNVPQLRTASRAGQLVEQMGFRLVSERTNILQVPITAPIIIVEPGGMRPLTLQALKTSKVDPGVVNRILLAERWNHILRNSTLLMPCVQ